MKLAPAKWKGSARQLIQDVLKPHFLDAHIVEAWLSFLDRRLSEADPIYVIGAPAPEMRSRWDQEKISLTHKNARIHFSDRAPAIAIQTYLRAIDQGTPEKMAALFLHLPFHVFDLDKFTRWASLSNNVASAGWLTAHQEGLLDADASWENLSTEQLRQMTLRQLDPLNMFLFPNLNKSGAVFADDPRVHALIAEAYAQFYGELWTRSLSLRRVSPSALHGVEDFEIDLSATMAVPESAKIESKEMISKITPTEAFDLKLVTVSESQGSHSRVLDQNVLSRGFLDIKLEYKEKSGNIQVVGFYRLNINDLYEKKFVARDAKGIRLLVHRSGDGQFAIGPRKTGPLASLP